MAVHVGGRGPGHMVRTVGGWTPAALGSKLYAWWDADAANTITASAGNVSAWADKVAGVAATEATQKPTYVAGGWDGVHSVVRFNGAQRLALPNVAFANGRSGVTVALVAKYAVVSSTHDVVWYSTGGAAQTRIRAGVMTGAVVTGGRRLDADAFVQIAGGAISAGQSAVSVHQLDAANALASVSTNGVNVQGAWETAGAFSATDSQSAWIGAVGGVGEFNGDLGEIVEVRATLADDERQKLEGYLAWKWGLQAQLPAGHPYRNLPP